MYRTKLDILVLKRLAASNSPAKVSARPLKETNTCAIGILREEGQNHVQNRIRDITQLGVAEACIRLYSGRLGDANKRIRDRSTSTDHPSCLSRKSIFSATTIAAFPIRGWRRPASHSEAPGNTRRRRRLTFLNVNTPNEEQSGGPSSHCFFQ